MGFGKVQMERAISLAGKRYFGRNFYGRGD